MKILTSVEMKKRWAKKKNRAFRIHSKTSRLEMPNKLKKDKSFMIGKASRFQQNVQLAERDHKST